MARLIIMEAGVSGDTAALHAHRKLRGDHEVVVVRPNSKWNWIPSNIWADVGFMNTEQVTFDLAPIYNKTGIPFYQAKAMAIYPEGNQKIQSGQENHSRVKFSTTNHKIMEKKESLRSPYE